MKPRVLVTRPLYPDVLEKLMEYFDVDVNYGPKYTPEELKSALQDMDGVLVAGGDRIDEQILVGLPGLRAVCVSAAGYNNIDVQALTRAGVIAANAPGPADETAADFAWGALIATARRLVEAERWVQQGHWKGPAGSRFFGTDVHGKKLGIIGMGRIGQAIARRAIGFGMVTVYNNRHRLDAKTEAECRAVFHTKEELLKTSDFIILSLPYTPGSRHIIGAPELKLMSPRSILINIARGGLIDEIALAQALSENLIAAAALDVFEGEPDIHSGLMGMPNAILTPHIAGATWETQHGLADLAADNLIAALGLGLHAGHPPSILNPEVLH